jgi:CubicO group peptidase (beta-lactamase class C family)
MLVGTVVMRLVEQGTLALDAPISQYLPWLHLSSPGLEDRIALRHLLSHTSGLCSFPRDFTSRDPDGLDVWAHEYQPKYPALTPPSRIWLYSNAGLSLAAYVAQTVTATPFARLMDELLFAPLDMDHTTFDPLVALTYPCAQGHQRRPDGAWEVDHQVIQNTAWDPAGGALSRVQDLSRVALLYLRHGALDTRPLLSSETIALMQTPLVKSWTRDEEGYGLTWATYEYKGHTLVRHNGGGVSSFQSVFILAPAQDAGLVLLANGGLTGELIRELLDVILEPPAQAPRPVLPAGFEADWPAFCGTYLGPYTGLVVVEMAGKRLSLSRNGTRYLLEPHCQRHYLGKSEDGLEVISVGFPAQGGPADRAEFVVVDDSPCERLASLPALTADPESWRRFVSSYELPAETLTPGRALHVDVEGQTLFLTFRAQRMRCLPLSATTFACDDGVMAFHETADGIVLEFQQTMQARRIPTGDGS